MIHVSARRFRCLNVDCVRKTFAERLDDALVFARRTKRLGDLQRYLGLALGGEAGTRLAERVAVPVSADTLLRMASAVSGETPAAKPRVLAVDDWATLAKVPTAEPLESQRRAGAAAIATEPSWSIWNAMRSWTCCPIDKPKRWPRGFAAIVARDRAGAYADGICQGAPDAVQVADRWHLLRNLGDAVQTVVDRQHVEVRRVAKQIAEEAVVPAASAPLAPPGATKPTAAEQRSRTAYARRHARYEEVARLKTAGASLKRIAVVVGAERKTVRRWLRAGGAPLWQKARQPGGLAPYHDHLDRRWTEGCHNAAQLWRELVTLGFAGRPGTVRQWAKMAKVPMATAICHRGRATA